MSFFTFVVMVAVLALVPIAFLVGLIAGLFIIETLDN